MMTDNMETKSFLIKKTKAIVGMFVHKNGHTL